MTSGVEVDVATVQGVEHGESGVVAGDQLLAFAEACAAGTNEQLADARADLVAELDEERMVDAAAIASAFQMMNRIANATGTPLDDPLVAQTEGLIPQIGVASFASAPGQKTD